MSTPNEQATPTPPSNNTSTNDVAVMAATTGLLSRITVTQMTLVVLVVVFVWQWLAGQQAIHEMEQQLARRIAEMDGSNKANQVLLSQSQEQNRQLSEKVAALEQRWAEGESKRAALEALYNDLSGSRDEMVLAEVEQMLLVAEQQLYLSANVKAALIALQSADARLQRTGQPVFNGLRKVLNQDMEKLRAVPDVDMAGLSFQLENIVDAVDNLPLIYQQRVSGELIARQPTAEGEESLWAEIWREAKQLVRIQHMGKVETPLLPPEQEYFLRENIKLRLLAARIALLSHDETGFKQKIKSTRVWLQRYFDPKSSITKQALENLDQLSAAAIDIELPDISGSLEGVRNYRLNRDKAIQ